MDLSPKTRNPSWTREEIILALDTYFKTDVHRLSASDVVIVQLSDTLRKLSAYEQEKRLTTYRNPRGVYM
jgi:5-methylcytosine-specific restriction protein A